MPLAEPRWTWQVQIRITAMLAIACAGCSRGPTGKWHFGNDFSDSKVRALVRAVEEEDLETIDRLVAAGADVNSEGRDGVTPLLWAMMAGKKHGFERLLERGADPNRPLIGRAWYAGYSVTNAAVRIEGDNFWLEAVLRHGGNPNCVEPAHQTTPVFDAVMDRKMSRLDKLVKAGGNLNHQDDFGNTPLITAAHIRWFEGVYYMLEAGGDHRTTDNAGFDLGCAVLNDQVGLVGDAERWRTRVLELLDKKGVDWEACRKQNATKGIKSLDWKRGSTK